jgi:signal transduction histidine kinase
MRGQLADGDERFDGIKSVIGVERGLAASRAPSPAPAAEPSGLGAGTASESPGEVRARAKAAPPSQAAFDRLNTPSAPSISGKQSLPGSLGRIEDLKLDSPYAESAREQQRASEERDMAQRLADPQMKKKLRSVRKEYALPTPLADDEGAAVMSLGATASASADTPADMPSARPSRIHTFESELDPFEFSVLDSGHFVLFRKVWRDGQRFIQGALIEQAPFLAGLVGGSFRDSALSRMSKVAVAWRGDVFAAFSGSAGRSLLASADELSGSLLHRTRLSAPLAEMELVYSVTRLPAGPGARVIAWTSAVLALVLVAGVWLMYRLGARQIALARQQQDFVSAVSHELKTPLTSIRMYAEMLKEGWSSEEKKRSYYEFIVQESERLSRLIANVLQLARMTRNEVAVQLREVAVSELMDGVRSTLVSQVEHAGFELQVDCDERAASASLLLDTDAFSQCLINLVDNALKFSAGCERKAVCVTCRLAGDGYVDFAVRDFGPGVPRDQMRKIFTLFYRSENELTRETVGTGIGLALVHQLARAMHGRVDVSNAEPGAVFTLSFRARSGS